MTYFIYTEGLGESLAGVVGFEGNKWAIRGFAASAVLLLGIINVAGVKWVVKLQFFLLLVLLCAGLNFMVGSFIGEDPGSWLIHLRFFVLILTWDMIKVMLLEITENFVLYADNGFSGWATENIVLNFWPSYSDGYTWFRVFGVFFPTITGVLSGINMSGDLRAPSTDIPNGTLAALSTS